MSARGGLLPGWGEGALPTNISRQALVPLSAPGLAGELVVVEDADAAAAMLTALQSVPVSALALDSEYGFARPPLKLRGGRVWRDVRSIVPICVSVAAWLDDGSAAPPVARYVLDVRVSEVVAALGELLRLPVPLVFHHAKSELQAFWALGLDPQPYQLYDTMVAAAALDLGRLHRRAGPAAGDEAEQAGLERAFRERQAHALSLLGLCQRYDVSHPFARDKDELRAGFLALAPGARLTRRQAEYAAADAEATLGVYAAQQAEVTRQGLMAHLQRVEFPFCLANARMEWRGVQVSAVALPAIRAACDRATRELGRVLMGYGMARPNSDTEFLTLMDRLGLGHLFTRRTRGGRRSTDGRALEMLKGAHPAVAAFMFYRKYSRLGAQEWLSGKLTGADGRVHPSHGQLGTATGRNTCSAPNLAGIGKVFRPAVVAPPGRALIELDFAQIEVGVAAAEHRDAALIAAFNSTDLYAAVAQLFYRDQLKPRERAMDPQAFKAARKDLRDRIKVFVLAVLYNMQAPAIATSFGVSLGEAEAMRERFLSMFPGVRAGLEASGEYGLLRGYAYVGTGLRRHVPAGTASRGWLTNAMRNAPIQAGATVVFKRTVAALDMAFHGTDTWLVLPIHDAVLIECDAGAVEEVRDTAEAIMRLELRALYPALTPRVDANVAAPHCWNKDGEAESIEAFLANPLAKLGLEAPPGE